MTGQRPGPRTRQDAIRDWMILAFAAAVCMAVLGCLFASPRIFGVSAVSLGAAAILTAAYFIAGSS